MLRLRLDRAEEIVRVIRGLAVSFDRRLRGPIQRFARVQEGRRRARQWLTGGRMIRNGLVYLAVNRFADFDRRRNSARIRRAQARDFASAGRRECRLLRSPRGFRDLRGQREMLEYLLAVSDRRRSALHGGRHLYALFVPVLDGACLRRIKLRLEDHGRPRRFHAPPDRASARAEEFPADYGNGKLRARL